MVVHHVTLTRVIRCSYDNDDEVRDRATTGLVTLAKANGGKYVGTSFNIPLANLEFALRQYQSGPSSNPFSISMVPAGERFR